MGKLRQFIKKILPEKLQHKYRLYVCNLNSRKSYEEIETKINKIYYSIMDHEMNWDNGESFTEKINISKVYGASPIKAELTDKVAVRAWVEKKIGKEYLIPLIGVYDNLKAASFIDLPEQFVIKCSHDSHSATVITSKEALSRKNISELIKKYDDFFLKRNFAYHGFEMHYANIPPKIIIEKCIGNNVKDYKFLCFNGVPHYCWVDMNRFSNHTRSLYDLNWVLQPMKWKSLERNQDNIKKPQSFSEMIEIVKKLCDGFDFVRVDLYDVNGKVYFGEMTFTSENGMERLEPLEWDYKLGQLWKFDYSLRRKIRKQIKKPCEVNGLKDN